jgi:hypothetical protein
VNETAVKPQSMQQSATDLTSSFRELVIALKSLQENVIDKKDEDDIKMLGYAITSLEILLEVNEYFTNKYRYSIDDTEDNNV